MFDLRSAGERERVRSLEVEGVEVVWVRPAEGSVAVGLRSFVERGQAGVCEDVFGGVEGFWGGGEGFVGGGEGRAWEGEGGVVLHCTGEFLWP